MAHNYSPVACGMVVIVRADGMRSSFTIQLPTSQTFLAVLIDSILKCLATAHFLRGFNFATITKSHLIWALGKIIEFITPITCFVH